VTISQALSLAACLLGSVLGAVRVHGILAIFDAADLDIHGQAATARDNVPRNVSQQIAVDSEARAGLELTSTPG
jgi:hypothetical protein